MDQDAQAGEKMMLPHMKSFSITATGETIFNEQPGKSAMEQMLTRFWMRRADKLGYLFDPDQKLSIQASWRGETAYYWATGYVLIFDHEQE